jgi:hypothetical protein
MAAKHHDLLAQAGAPTPTPPEELDANNLQLGSGQTINIHHCGVKIFVTPKF